MISRKISLLAFTSLFLAAACKKEEAPRQDGPKAVTTVKVDSRNVTGYNEFPATVEGRVNNEVRAKIQGYITQVLVDEGQYVQRGQPLFRLETDVLTQSASAARAGVGAAQSSVAAANANVKAAQAAVNAAQVEVNKLRPLVEKNIISSIQLQTAQANLARAQAQLSQALASKQEANAGVSQARANYQGIQANVNYSVITAPVSGVVGKINLRTGSLVGPSDQTSITTVSDTSELYAYFSMNEKEYLDFLKNSYGATVPEKLKNMPMVDFRMANGDIYPEKGRVEAVTGQIDPQTGTIQFRVSLPNPQKLLSNGNTGTILVPNIYDNILVVPASSTYEQQGLVYVYKVEKDTARNQVIEVADRVDNLVLINKGVKKGETVVAQGVGTLKDRTAVKGELKTIDEITDAIQPVFAD